MKSPVTKSRRMLVESPLSRRFRTTAAFKRKRNVVQISDTSEDDCKAGGSKRKRNHKTKKQDETETDSEEADTIGSDINYKCDVDTGMNCRGKRKIKFKELETPTQGSSTDDGYTSSSEDVLSVGAI